ncbi:Acetyl esterase/lipase [Filimonas lacunae]|uniref:Acetyl esterase/lipase n=2 Tax=Filimonas lacunae TaxID=477680 RepID=A0A173MBV0_9BACT|nr:lipase [Filimonas lacunae]SIT34312.1 Acetyl esterase/lipase [Filimonas lacunae]
MKRSLKKLLSVATVMSATAFNTNTMAQVIDPAKDPNVESHVKGFLKAVNAATPMPVEQMPIDKARATYAYATSVGDKPDISGVEITEKMIQEDGLSVKLHIVRPANVKNDIPAFMYFHGGIWFMGDFDSHKTLLRDLVVQSGIAAVFVDFTRTPDAHYPQQNNEAYAATKWIAAHGKEVMIDGSKLAVAGNSVGGNMATVVALMAKEKKGPQLKLQVLISPVTDANFNTASYKQFANGRFLTRGLMMKGWDLYIKDPAQRKEVYASPLQASADQLKGLPPALVITEENDVLRDEGEAYARKLDEAGVYTISTRYNGMIHDFVIINSLQPVPSTIVAIQQIASVLKAFVR